MEQSGVAGAVAIQRALAGQVERASRLDPVKLIAGVDCSAPRFAQTIRAAIVLLRWPELTIVEQQRAEVAVTWPYIPGLLSFRELPAISAAWQALGRQPQLVFVDGQGIAHPRRIGIASHLGVALDIPTIGVAKSLLTGKNPEALGPNPGDRADLYDRNEVVGVLLRTRRGSRPLVISTGHRVALDDAVRWVEQCCRGYRLPEPTRLAHAAAATRLTEGGNGAAISHPAAGL